MVTIKEQPYEVTRLTLDNPGVDGEDKLSAKLEILT